MLDPDDDLLAAPRARLASARERGIYLLPNLLTLGGLFAGFYAIVAAMSGRFVAAALAIGVAGIMDGIDGRVARWTGTSSDFGKELDSLCDMVSFGVAPAIVVYHWGFESIAEYGWLWAKLGWIGPFFYTAAAAMRLARFNVRVHVQDKRYFQGLPSPAAAAVVAAAVLCGAWYGAYFDLTGSDMSIPAFIITLGMGVLMISNIGYYSFKDFDPRQPIKFRYLVLIPTVLMAIAIEPPLMLFVTSFTFAVSGPLMAAWRWKKRREAARPV
jgi:CDP-diacylglycerol--serine O-phosphatidyltransferase